MTVDCRARAGCPDGPTIARAVLLFVEEYPTFDASKTLDIEHHASGEIFVSRGVRNWAETDPDGRRIRVSRLVDLPHELIHVVRIRASTPDNHPPNAAGEQPWVVDPSDNERERRLKAAFKAIEATP